MSVPSVPASVKDLVGGRMGKPHGGFPKGMVKRILKDEKPMRGRAGSTLPAVGFTAAREEVRKLLPTEPTEREVLSHVLYPTVFKDYVEHRLEYGDTRVLPTPVFLPGMVVTVGDLMMVIACPASPAQVICFPHVPFLYT